MSQFSACPQDNAHALSDEQNTAVNAAICASEQWRIMIVDDDPSIHIVTRMVLQDIEFLGKKIEMVSTYTAQAAIDILSSQPDIALVLIDVVMEEEDSGLKLVKHIRNTLCNKRVRLMLRTGQPGRAPEDAVMIEYDINDYREKTELSSTKLITSVIAALRAFADICQIYQLNSELEQKVEERTKELSIANDRLRTYLRQFEEDHMAGARVQCRLLPKDELRIEPYLFSRLLLPSLHLSGDFIDYFEIDSRFIGFYIADVSGHGTSSAFVTVVLKHFMHNFAEKHRRNEDHAILDPIQLIARLNQDLIQDNFEKYITIFYGILDRQTNMLTFCNCGHDPLPILYNGEKSEFLNGNSTPIGLFEEIEILPQTIQLPSQFILLFLSDGILDIIPEKSMHAKKDFLLSIVQSWDVSIESLSRILQLNIPRTCQMI